MFIYCIKRGAAWVVLLALFLTVGAYTGVAQEPGSLAMHLGFEESVSEQSAAQVPAPTAQPEDPDAVPPEEAPPRPRLAEYTGLIIAVIALVLIAIVVIIRMRRPQE